MSRDLGTMPRQNSKNLLVGRIPPFVIFLKAPEIDTANVAVEVRSLPILAAVRYKISD